MFRLDLNLLSMKGEWKWVRVVMLKLSTELPPEAYAYGGPIAA